MFCNIRSFKVEYIFKSEYKYIPKISKEEVDAKCTLFNMITFESRTSFRKSTNLFLTSYNEILFVYFAQL